MPQWVSGKSEKILMLEAERMITKVISCFGEPTTFSGYLFEEKILGIVERLHKKEDIGLAKYALSIVEDQYVFPYGEYHGDLTMANILYSKDKPYLIDFLPGYIQSPVLDVVKIKQEYSLRWSSLLMDVDDWYFRFTDILEDLSARFNTLNTQIVEIINLLRILPYIKDDTIHSVVINQIKKLMK
jgi:thiamine kinase-like enzyme